MECNAYVRQGEVKRSQAGLFITFEGGEGSGKTTQLRLLAESLKKAGHAVLTTREPGGTESAEAIRRLLVEGKSEQWDAVSETLLFLAARRNHYVQKILPALQSGQVVLCDRFADSTLVYQGIGKGLGLEYVRQLSRLSLGALQPDLTLLFDIAPEDGLKRAKKRETTETRFEQLGLEFHHIIRAGFLALAAASPERFRIIHAKNDMENVQKEVKQALDGFFSL